MIKKSIPSVGRGINWLFDTPAGGFCLFLVPSFIPLVIFMGTYLKGDPQFMFLYFVFPFILSIQYAFLTTVSYNPLDWWRIWQGYEVVVDSAQYVYGDNRLNGWGPSDSLTITDEIDEWVRTMAKGKYYKVNAWRYKFKDKSDAAMFKLAWYSK